MSQLPHADVVTANPQVPAYETHGNWMETNDKGEVVWHYWAIDARQPVDLNRVEDAVLCYIGAAKTGKPKPPNDDLFNFAVTIAKDRVNCDDCIEWLRA